MLGLRLMSGVVLLSGCILAGCAPNSGEKAEAILRIDRESFDSEDKFQIFRETQAALIKSHFVIARALSSDEVPKGLTTKAVKDGLSVELPDDSDLLSVSLPVGSRSRDDTEAILNEVIKAYRSES